MKIKIIGGLISFLLLVLSLLLFIKDDSKVEIITSPKIYSIVKSSDNEGFNITILTNNLESYYFNQTYITKIALTSETDEMIPLTLEEITKTNDNYLYDNKQYKALSFKVQIGFSSDDYLVSMNKTYLNITYKNAQEITIYIGEFNYLFSSEENKDISLNNLLSTHGIVNNVDTLTGLFLNLGNISDKNITINKIEIGSKQITANNYYLSELNEIPEYDALPTTILGLDTYYYDNELEDVSKNILLRKNNEILLYLPFNYSGDIAYIYRFYVKVYYVIDGEEKVFVIDDFPYINTSLFKSELESGFYYYEFYN